MKSKAELIRGWMKLKRAKLVEIAREENIHTDETMKKLAICEALYQRLREKVKEAKAAAKLKERQEEAAEAKPDTSPASHNLHPMKQPASYKILVANAAVYEGILSERIDQGKKVHRVLTGSGQLWEFPID